jgi:hypothetical protein
MLAAMRRSSSLLTSKASASPNASRLTQQEVLEDEFAFAARQQSATRAAIHVWVACLGSPFVLSWRNTGYYYFRMKNYGELCPLIMRQFLCQAEIPFRMAYHWGSMGRLTTKLQCNRHLGDLWANALTVVRTNR